MYVVAVMPMLWTIAHLSTIVNLANSVRTEELVSPTRSFKLKIWSARFLEPSSSGTKIQVSDHFVCITKSVEDSADEYQLGLSPDNIPAYDCWLQLIPIPGKTDTYTIFSPAKNVSLYMYGSIPAKEGDTKLIKEMFVLRAHRLIDSNQMSAEFQVIRKDSDDAFCQLFHPMYQIYLRASGNRKDPDPVPIVGYIAATAALDRGIILEFGGEDFEIKL